MYNLYVRKLRNTSLLIILTSVTLALIYGHPRNFPYPRLDRRRNRRVY